MQNIQSGGPSYPVFLGRRDGLKSDAAWVDLPSPSISWESALAYFTSKGLNVQDMATLLGTFRVIYFLLQLVLVSGDPLIVSYLFCYVLIWVGL